MIADPKYVNIYLRSKSFAETSNLEDYWYKTKYSREAFTEHHLKLMQSPSLSASAKKKIDLPPPNNLIPKNLGVLPPNPELS